MPLKQVHDYNYVYYMSTRHRLTRLCAGHLPHLCGDHPGARQHPDGRHIQVRRCASLTQSVTCAVLLQRPRPWHHGSIPAPSRGCPGCHDDDKQKHSQFWPCPNQIRSAALSLIPAVCVPDRDDPTILAWELCNEPRCEGDFSGSILLDWVESSAEFLKSLDPHHLLTIGAEGFLGSSTPGRPPGPARTGRPQAAIALGGVPALGALHASPQ